MCNAQKRIDSMAVWDPVSFVERGGTLTKLGSNGKKYKRRFFVDRETMALCHDGSRACCRNPDRVRKWVPISNIAEVVTVEDSRKQGPSAFSLGLSDQKEPKTLIAASREARDSWVDGLRCLVVGSQSADDDDAVQLERMWLEERFADADRDKDGQLDGGEVARLLSSLNVPVAEPGVAKQLAKLTPKLNVDEFVQLYNELSKRRELEDLFNK